MRSFIRIIGVILLVLCMGTIFYLSSQPAEVSSQISGGLIEIIAEKVYPDFEALSQTEKVEIVASLQFVVRKAAHVCGFAAIGFFAFLSFITYTRLRLFVRTLLAVAVSAIYAASDELHQRFVPGRSCELRDFLLDFAGILTAILLSLAFVGIVGPLRRRVAFERKKPKQMLIQNVNKTQPLIVDSVECEKAVIEEFEIEQQMIEESVEILDLQELEEALQIDNIGEVQEMEEKKTIELSAELEYAASVIGEAVIESAKVCNKLTAEGDENTKELVNLVLGRNEVFKSEILQILSLETSFEQKQNLIQSEKTKAYDYFNSILAQMC